MQASSGLSQRKLFVILHRHIERQASVSFSGFQHKYQVANAEFPCGCIPLSPGLYRHLVNLL